MSELILLEKMRILQQKVAATSDSIVKLILEGILASIQVAPEAEIIGFILDFGMVVVGVASWI